MNDEQKKVVIKHKIHLHPTDETIELRTTDRGKFIRWMKGDDLIVDRPAFGAEEKLIELVVSRRIGLTATPERSDKISLRGLFPDIGADYPLYETVCKITIQATEQVIELRKSTEGNFIRSTEQNGEVSGNRPALGMEAMLIELLENQQRPEEPDMQDGGPAFPSLAYEVIEAGEEIGEYAKYDGASLRDYFAAHAPDKIKISPFENGSAENAYWYADAMLKARKK